MSQGGRRVSRRAFLRRLAGLAAGLGTGLAGASWKALAADDPLITRAIHATGERVPVIGMGSSLTFDVGDDPVARAVRVQVLQAFFDHGGAFIDSSPMYGFSEDVIGHCLASIKNDTALFSATKVWTPGQRRGRRQMKRSMGLWGLEAFDLMQIHNMLDWESHLETLKQWKEEGRIRYVGITTSHGRRHERLEKALREEDFDFVQFTYNLEDREAERRLLPLAAERGIAVIINRPFRRGALIDGLRGKPLPSWAAEIDCRNWPQFLLKFIVSHPAVTCAIPATTRVDHMRENMGACRGRLPDAATRRRMVRHFESL